MVQLLGNVFVAILVGNVLAILAGLDKQSAKHRARTNGVESLMQQFPIPRHLRHMLRKWVVRPVPVPPLP